MSSDVLTGDAEMSDNTVFVLTVDLPRDLSERLRGALRRHPQRTLRDIALEALDAWLEDDEGGRESAPA
jgi:hypothetical protein